MMWPLSKLLPSRSLADEHLRTRLNELPLEYYQQIYPFCEVRNSFNACNQTGPSERVRFLTSLLDSLHVPYEIDAFANYEGETLNLKCFSKPPVPEKKPFDLKALFFGLFSRNGKHAEAPPEEAIVLQEVEQRHYYYNIILPGNSSRMVIAHHDVCNLKSENANDNSASVINAIAAKRLRPDAHVVLTDGEEPGGMFAGARRLASQINAGIFGRIEWVLNLELTGSGGTNFLVGDHKGRLVDHIENTFYCARVQVPPNDAYVMQTMGINAAVINPLPLLPKGEKGRDDCRLLGGRYLDFDVIMRCHTLDDSVSHIRPDEMKQFVEKIILRILDS